MSARDQRRDVVAWLAGEGMSTRAIAPIVGTTHKTVVKDLQVVPEVPPAALDASAPPVVELGEMSDAELRQVAATGATPSVERGRLPVLRGSGDQP